MDTRKPPNWHDLNDQYLTPEVREALQRMQDLAFRGMAAEQGDTAGDGVANPGMGLDLLPPQHRNIWARITANDPGTPLYSFEQIVHQSFEAVTVEGGITGTLNLLETNGNTEVPINSVVQIWPSEDSNGEAWRFTFNYPTSNPSAGNTFNYYDTTFNFNYGVVVNYLNSITYNIASNASVIVNGPGLWYFGAPLVICDWLFWCYVDYTVATAVLVDWSLPADVDDGDAVVFRLDASADFAISGMVAASPPAASETHSPRTGGAGWTNSDNVFFLDQQYAVDSVAVGGTSEILQATGYGFSLPAGAVVLGISVTIRRGKEGDGVIDDTEVQLLKAGVAAGTAKNNATDWPLADGDLTLGNSSDLWGTTWTAAEVANAGFGVQLFATEDGTDDVGLRVDVITITVYYTLNRAGQVIALRNVSDYVMTLLHEDTASAAGNRLDLEDAEDKDVGPSGIVLCWKDPASNRWAVFRQPGGGMTGENGQSTQTTPTTLSNTWTGHVTVSLPTPGTYLVTGQVTMAVSDATVSGFTAQARLWNSSTSVQQGVIARVCISALAAPGVGTAGLTAIVTTSSANEDIDIEVRHDNGMTDPTSGEAQNACLDYVRIA